MKVVLTEQRKRLLRVLACIVLLIVPLFLQGTIEARAGNERSSGTILKANMKRFVDVKSGKTTYHMAQMSGKDLKKLGCTAVNKEHQYFVWFMVDDRAVTNNTWYTKKIYLTKKTLTTLNVANLGNNRIADFDTSRISSNSSTSGKISGLGSTGGVTVPASSIGTLFYYDSTKLMEIAEEKKLIDERTLRFTGYLSPLIDHKINGKALNQDYTNCFDWYTNRGSSCYWADRNFSNYTAHYNVPVTLEADKVKVITRHRTMGHRLEDDFKVLDMDNQVKAGSGKWDIAATGKGIIKQDISKPYYRGDKDAITPDNVTGDPAFHRVDAYGKGAKDEFVVTGYKIYYKSKASKQDIILAYNTLDVTNFAESDNALRCKATKNDLHEVLNDKRYLKTGKSTDSIKGAEHTAEWFSSVMNTYGKTYLWLDEEHGFPDDADTIYVDWLYTKAERLGVTVNLRYVNEGIKQKTSPMGNVEEMDKELSYVHNYSSSKLVKNTTHAVKKGERWYSYAVKRHGEDVYEDDLAAPVMDRNGNPDSSNIIPYVIKYGKSSRKCYLTRIKITPEDPNDYKGMSAKDFWDKGRMQKGSVSKDGKSFIIDTNAAYMAQYTSSDDGLFYDNEKGDWITDVNVMSHFTIPDVQHDVQVDCYYSATVPIQVLVYTGMGGGSYLLANSPNETYWQSQGTQFSYKGVSENSNDLAAVFAVSDKSTKLKPYRKKNSYKRAYGSIEEIKSISGCTQLKIGGSQANVDVGYDPIYLILVYRKTGVTDVGYTLVRYIHTGDGYLKTYDEFFPLSDTEHGESHFRDGVDKDGNPIKIPIHGTGIMNWTARAYVSFPEYEEYDEGNQGLNGSIYQLSSVVYNYEGPNNDRPLKAKAVPEKGQKRKSGSNNRWYYLDEAGDEADDINAVTTESRNSLVVYAIYEDKYRPLFPGSNPNGSRIFSSEDKTEVLHWNWELPDRFVWDKSMFWDGEVADGNLKIDPANFSNPYYAKVFGTNESAVFKAQEAIPSSDYVRLTASVPRYLTRDYWIRHDLKSIYKVLCVKAYQSKDTKRMVDGDQKLNDCNNVTSHEYIVYEDGGVSEATATVERGATFYTLGNAEVWDPERVTLENNTFCDSACSKDGLATLMPVNGESHALFTESKAPANFAMPPIQTNWLMVNFGVENSEKGDEDRYDFSEGQRQKKAESIIGQYTVCNDEVSFNDGLGNRTVLTTSSTGLVPSVSKPKGVPDADYTLAGVFDSKNHTQAGIQLIPDINNGHHDTLSTAYYKQVQCTNPKYKTSERIKTVIQDDGDDDVEIFTPMVNYSKINLDYDNGTVDDKGVTINPEYNYNQRSGESYGASKSVMALDMEYTLTLSCNGYNSDFEGYGSQNYARYLEKDADGDRYMQVLFPFPVEMTISLAGGGWEQRYYKADSWISLKVPLETGEQTYTFFIPSWAGERDKANIKFRGITINARKNNPEFTMLQEPYNPGFVADELKTGKHLETIDERNYVAQTHEDDNLVGRLYGLQIIDISDYPLWQPAFRQYDESKGSYSPLLSGNAYRSGLNNQNGLLGSWGQLWTTPSVDGSHPTDSSAGTLGTGYKIRYKMESVGNYFTALDGISIKPEFYYMNSKGEYLKEDGSWDSSSVGRKEVSVYYNETVGGSKEHLVKVGSDEDKMNQKTLQLTSEDFGISEDVLEKTADSMGIDVGELGKIREQFCFSDIELTSDMRVYVGDTHISYKKAAKGSKAEDARYEFNPLMYGKVETEPALADVLSQDEILKSVQQWYGEYYVPSETYVTTSSWDEISKEISGGFDGSEPCWLDGGYLVVNFKPILTTSNKPRLNYDNTVEFVTPSGNLDITGCNMFEIENYVSAKKDSNGRNLAFKDGDMVLYVIKNARSGGPDPERPDPGEPEDPDPDNPEDPDPDDRNDGVPDGGGGVSAKDGYSSYGTH